MSNKIYLLLILLFLFVPVLVDYVFRTDIKVALYLLFAMLSTKSLATTLYFGKHRKIKYFWAAYLAGLGAVFWLIYFVI